MLVVLAGVICLPRLPLRFHEFGALRSSGMRPAGIGAWLAAGGKLPIAGADQRRRVQVLPVR
jgi:hypothetical protein